MADDEIRSKSSSGGVFTLCADLILADGGYVCGAAFTNDFRSVEHIIINNPDELFKLQKSKYIQSDTKYVYAKIKNLLNENDSPVLFVGCPCQADALYSFLGTDYPQLYTIDFICHGVPSPMLWAEYIDYLSGGKNITHVDFRSKKEGWKPELLLSATFDDGSLYTETNNGLWYTAFLKNSILRKSCSHCRYANMSRPGDITIGDYWGGAGNTEYDDGKGTSLVIINNKKGMALFERIKPFINCLCKEIKLESAKDKNSMLMKSGIESGREEFFTQYKKCNNIYKALSFISSELNNIKRRKAVSLISDEAPNRNIAMWGAGKDGTEITKDDKIREKLLFFIDNNTDKQKNGVEINGFKYSVYSPDNAVALLTADDVIVIVSSRFGDEIEKELISREVKNKIIKLK